MLQEIKLYLFVLSVIFILKVFMVEFTVRLFDTNPKELKFDDLTKVFLYLAFSYVITSLILF